METKVCIDCQIAKPASEYHNQKGRYLNSASRCKPCQVIYMREWYLNNKQKVKESTRRNRYKRDFNLTVDEYNAILASQGGGCAICGITTSASGKLFPVDHNHKTGAVRGILCDPCNRGLGFFKDNPSLLIKASNYLER